MLNDPIATYLGLSMVVAFFALLVAVVRNVWNA